MIWKLEDQWWGRMASITVAGMTATARDFGSFSLWAVTHNHRVVADGELTGPESFAAALRAAEQALAGLAAPARAEAQLLPQPA